MCLGDVCAFVCFFFQAEDGIRDLVRSRGLGDVYKRQAAAGVEGQGSGDAQRCVGVDARQKCGPSDLSLIHI